MQQWNEDRVEKLKELWGEGLSAREIADSLGGVTRNAVIGKAHRLGLSTRSVKSRPAIGVVNAVVERTCQWPIGNPGESGFHFCKQPVEPGRPYCAGHCALAYRHTGHSAA